MAKKTKNSIKCISPEGTALWLKVNTGLTEHQICSFTGINSLTYDGLFNIAPESPLLNSQLTRSEIIKAENDSSYLMENFVLGKEETKTRKSKK